MTGLVEVKKLLAILNRRLNVKSVLITIYILLVLAFSATSRAEVTIDPILTDYQQIQSELFVGQVAMTVNQDFYLIVSENEFYQLASNIDLSEYNGQVVQVTGVKVLPKVDPSNANPSVGPLPLSEGAEGTAQVIVVLEISGTVN